MTWDKKYSKNCKYGGKIIYRIKDVLVFLEAVSGGYVGIFYYFEQW